MSVFEYLSVYISIVIGLGVVHLLTGLVRILGEPESKPYWVHVVWILFMLGFLTFFWWFSFDWRFQEQWTFYLFLFVVFYSMLVYLLCVVLLPATPPPGHDYRTFFFERHRAFFALLCVAQLTDIADAYLKGPENVASLGPMFLPTSALLLSASLSAAIIRNPRFHAVFSVANLAWFAYSISLFGDVFVS